MSGGVVIGDVFDVQDDTGTITKARDRAMSDDYTPTTDAVKHGPDWSDWQEGDDGDGCLCGFNGTSQECASHCALDATKDGAQ